MDHDYKAAHEFWLSGLYLEKPITNTEKAIDSALEIARKLQEGYVAVDSNVPFDNALNDAGWKLNELLEDYVEVTPNLFNNLKATCRDVIKCWLTAAQETRKG